MADTNLHLSHRSVSGYTAQLNSQAAILVELTAKVRQGTLGEASGATATAKVVFMGHSFGSSVSLAATAATAATPEAGADAVVFTGFGFNASILNGNGFFQAVEPRIAAGQRPEQWGHLDSVCWSVLGGLEAGLGASSGAA